MTIEIIEINPKVGEHWYVQLPGKVALNKAEVRYIGQRVVEIRYYEDSYSTYGTFLSCDLIFMEKCPE